MEVLDYEKYPLKQYKYWTTYLHYNQAYLGRCYIALNRSGNLDPYTDTTAEERTELETVITETQAALDALYQPGLYNYANFRNTWPRCHWHVIPRYETHRTIDGQEFTDKNWGKNYAPYDRGFSVAEELFQKIQKDITQALQQS
jgi:diadenosine tetraphosphate (Ap4A) HIT family hydrolase